VDFHQEETMDEIQATTEPIDPRRRWKRAFWGLFLIALGSAFLLDRLGLADLPGVGRLWPGIFVILGLSSLVEGRPGDAVTNLLIGTWAFACNEGWWGLEFFNSWGLVLVAVGTGIVIRALSGEGRRARLGGSCRGGVL
jgi:hypothetical protein